jgi:hypothetical protein
MIDTMNKFLVASLDGGIVFLKPLPQRMTPDDALLLAAYLVSMAEHEASNDFADVLKAVQSA